MGSLIAFAAIVVLLLVVVYLMYFRSPARRGDAPVGPSDTDYTVYDNGSGGSDGHHGGH